VSNTDKRTAHRFRLSLPLIVRWKSDGAGGEEVTQSRDVSSRGISFYLPKGLKNGSAVEIVMTLPNEITMAGPVKVRCLGRVQRTEGKNGQRVGVVAAIERYEFLRGDEDAA
jgi:hypothetical protein